MSDQNAIRDRVRKLRDRTTTRGFTEDEAMSAAAKAAELMAEHGLHTGDVEFEQRGSREKSSGKAFRAKLWGTIARCTSTAAILTERGGPREVAFIGKAPGPEIAVYLREVCDRAIETEIARFKADPFYRRRRSVATKRAAVADFQAGMVLRLRSRLISLFAASIEAGEAEAAASQRELDRRYPDTATVRQTAHKPRYEDAVWAGRAAGGRPTLAQGVGAGATPLQIGRD